MCRIYSSSKLTLILTLATKPYAAIRLSNPPQVRAIDSVFCFPPIMPRGLQLVIAGVYFQQQIDIIQSRYLLRRLDCYRLNGNGRSSRQFTCNLLASRGGVSSWRQLAIERGVGMNPTKEFRCESRPTASQQQKTFNDHNQEIH